MTAVALAAVAALGDNCTCLSPMAAPTGREQERTSPCGQTYPSHLWVAQPDFTRQEKTLATSHPNVSPLLASLSLVFPYSSSCQRSPSACFFFFLCRLPLCRPHTAAGTTVRGFGILPVPSLSRAMLLSRPHQGGIVAAAQPQAEGVCSRLKVAKSCTPVLHFHHVK